MTERFSQVGRLLRAHPWLVSALALGALARLVAQAGYRPGLWFNDSFDYLQIALSPFAHPIRPVGYGLFLWALKPLGSVGAVVAAQHLLGLLTGVLVYALLRRRGLPGWGAALAASAILLDGDVIELETLLLSDTLFLFLLVAALTILLWPGLGLPWQALAGLSLAAATMTRTIGLPVLGIVLVWLGFRWLSDGRGRDRLRALGAVALAGLLPLGGYAVWFHAENDRYALTATDGVFLWGRTAAFVHCDRISPELRYLCPAGPPATRKASSSQVWDAASPIGWTYGAPFDPRVNADAQRFALEAIAAQPLDYAGTVGHDLFIRTFGWHHGDHPTPATARKYDFPTRPDALPTWPVLGGGTPADVIAAYDPSAAHRTSVVDPWATLIRGYQAVVSVRGPLLAVVLLLPLILLARRRVFPGLPWAVAVVLLAFPPLTVDFDHRYVVTATPVAALAAGYAFTRRRRSSADESERHLAASTAL
ncbi:phospholipid carrier-dependent glycosyltransferase [Actinocorallia sp. API 0066]|uniref:phospholipid carrier-dependent glycosyltransferase n=1 Tax=Actinocorallia sp. API 0066 TaxID=2896846 RepID=UPI001E5DA7C8|nr:phospholipid carrier-dependent glycosyltransferase [Actinocorallia sp. API 0066]MCD0447780.1 phospholipid carrier-dependent glycosyltransferase [Actinocorallia sp. API 0066]